MEEFRKIIGRHAALLGLLAATGTAQAQSGSVTLYGVVDVNIEYVNNMRSSAGGPGVGPAENRYSLNSGGTAGSRWGIRGTEDLGPDLKAVFALESAFSADDGKLGSNNRLFGRQAFVGLDSHYGTFTFGRQYISLFEAFSNFVPEVFAPQYEPTGAFLGRYFREDNTLKYAGRYGPMRVFAHWSFGVDTTSANAAGEQPGNFRSGTAWGAGTTYASGPFGLALGYDEVHPAASAGGPAGKNQKAALAVSYAADKFDLKAGYRWGRNDSQAAAQLLRDDYYWVGGTYYVSPAFSTTLALYFDNVKRLGTATDLKNPWQLALLAKYSLSKRTNLYLTTAYSKHSGLNFETSVAGGSVYTLGAGKDSQFGVALGIRHIF